MGAICGKTKKTNKIKNCEPEHIVSVIFDDKEDKEAYKEKIQRVMTDNPFLYAILEMTQKKTEMLTQSYLNASKLQDNKLQLSDFKNYNEYSKDLNFQELIIKISKNYIQWSEFNSKLGCCVKDAWLIAVTKYAIRFLGRVNFFLRFGQECGVDVVSKNIWDKEIEDTVAYMNEKENDYTRIAWTNQFERNLTMMIYGHVYLNSNEFDEGVVKNAVDVDQFDWKKSVFGPEDWKTFFQLDVSSEPNAKLPENAESIMNEDGNIFKGSESLQVFHTHILTYVPNKLKNWKGDLDLT